ncbi:winged helix-turn-helix transcriptional regulator [Methanolobus sediminis]|uniref:Winged helix-turn-helix transcriptional regulator n=1 Tax=Methanolobus sediminis TaxID=3072978 RepID=A0AA51YN85_9EURY|nr:winged helix-turn-helix transcriptional regulator [Methanolobus sediminis]WMW26383.1 winged helix-turn-helix transcriptional regulator [Methanolobus sediminis]
MRIGSLIRAGLILIIIFGTILTVCTLNGDDGYRVKKSPFFYLYHPSALLHPFGGGDEHEYIVTPGHLPLEEGDVVDDSGADKQITFWELPLWIQLSVISGAVFSTVTLLKCLPLLLGKILARGTNPKMQEIASYIAENPGCMESEIAHDLDLKRGTLRYHLSRLSSDNRIQKFKKGKLKRLFHITYSKTEEQKVLHLHKKNENRKRIIEIITERPGITGKELANLLKIDKSTVHWHIKELHKDDLIDFKKNGRYKMYYPHVSILSDDVD